MSTQRQVPIGVTVSTLQESIRRHARYSLGKAWRDLSARDLFTAVALSVRDHMVERMLETEERYRRRIPSACTIFRSSF